MPNKKKKTVPEPVKKSSSSQKGLACFGIGCVGLILLVLLTLVVIAVGIFLKVKSDPTFISTLVETYSGAQMTATPTPTSSVLMMTPTPTEKTVMIQPSVSTETVTGENAGDYVLAFSSRERVLTSDLVGLSPWNLKVARNEIYARHGRPFVSKDLSCYFAGTSWYAIDRGYSDARLTDLELANAVFILNYEKSSGSTIYDRDTGCSRSR